MYVFDTSALDGLQGCCSGWCVELWDLLLFVNELIRTDSGFQFTGSPVPRHDRAGECLQHHAAELNPCGVHG